MEKPLTVSLRKAPKPHQLKAISDVNKGLIDNECGQLISACGTGKTLTCLWIVEASKASYVLILAPSLSLLAQIKQAWQENAQEPFRSVIVCSDKTVKGEDVNVVTAEDLGTPVTTNVDDLKRELSNGPCYVFATYQSSNVVAAAQPSDMTFDLVIADEAHRTAAPKTSTFATILDRTKIKAKRRLFTTATPRVSSGEHSYSMDDESVFGSVLHKLSFGSAVEQGLLSDYRLYVVGISDEQCAKEVLQIKGEYSDSVRRLAAQVAISKAINAYKLRRLITFHSRVDAAQKFAEELNDKHDGPLWASSVNGKMPSKQRLQLIQQLDKPPEGGAAILSNAKCLAEGIDVAALDGVVFVDPRGSQVDIVQAVGRVMRTSPGKDKGTIIVPVIIDKDQDPEEALEGSEFKTIWSVLRALRDHDERLAAALDHARGTDLWPKEDNEAKLPSNIDIDMETLGALAASFHKHLELKAIEKARDIWSCRLEQVKCYFDKYGEWPNEKTASPHNHLAAWVTHQRMLKRRGDLPAHREHKLTKRLPAWEWNPNARVLREAEAYVAQHGSLSALPCKYVTPTGYSLGAALNHARYKIRKGVNPYADYVIEGLRRLPGWSTERTRNTSSEIVVKLVEYAQQTGTVNVPIDFICADGYKLGIAMRRLRSSRGLKGMSTEDKRICESLPGWQWMGESERKFNRMVRTIDEFYQTNSRLPKVSGTEQKLAVWLRDKLKATHKNIITDHIKRQLDILNSKSWWRDFVSMQQNFRRG